MRKWLKIMAQTGFFVIVSILMNILVEWLDIAIPGSIIGMFLVFFLLQLKWIRLEWIDAGASFLLAELLLFFIPPSVGIISYQNLMLHEGFQIFIVIAIGTAIVMAASGLLAQRIAKRKEQSQS
ncbi:CidA/LrgA family holin-like protein [Brevibacillus nitrificans]|uniref:CidA/LrgA family holin-like protein n=1 Tax=Brevibacillus nitrificans TaxID=651560 RepID=A0A3M8D9W9_9BACL|nr:CidA/LrgA family holin-like protein [Brevibacillus nitrificans]RNB84826.1 CidA/LrgA family holin-like protein [Brevibacillus nitrificans]